MATPTTTAAHGASSPDRGRRSTTRPRALAVILALVLAVLVYGVGIEPRFILS